MTRLLIANRGEIAIRIARAAREAGIVPLGIYSEADRTALPVEAMDDALCIGPAAAAESYLAIDRVIAAALELRADAVHPGYGFLSERAPFAQAVVDAGLIFVGPSPPAIAAMGDKIEAKRRVRDHDVPVIPGYGGDEQTPAALRREAERIGLPLLIKASSGGGGRGMRVVADLATFDEALESAQREALAAFGAGTVLLERYLTRPRHIEFQIIADVYGNTIHLGERECSIQRRHQKVIEEAPSVALDPALRERMGAAAVRAARSVEYANAGTVEFLLDEDGAFYFLEMNARLQVEHPVTELVHGVDLVRLQLELAAGARLEIARHDVATCGWAIEARINAEDPNNAFLPASGRINRWDAPGGEGVRLDSGVAAGSDVSIHYDSMLAKLIASGPTRAVAIDRLTRALESFRIEGVHTNVPLLLEVVRTSAFRSGETTTAFLSEHAEVLSPATRLEPDEPFLLAIGAIVADSRSWRLAGVGIPIRLAAPGRQVAVTASRFGSGEDVRLEGDLSGDVRFEVVGERVVAYSAGRRHAGRARV
ncbi:MAG: acetyl-CoA carboxylase biotin carboxylase subunit, partial [Candidatus Eremiobacteraeota bacterium]|nr:acetyl-CoA carboxylase biotin carboxylase subunit [Candidatus Eremiobacteraeota bacterium]